MIKYLLFGNSAFHKILLENVVGMNMFSVNHSLPGMSSSSTKDGILGHYNRWCHYVQVKSSKAHK